MSTVPPTTTETYTYDRVGNRLSSLGLSPCSYNSSNQLTPKPGTTYTYDANGNVTSKTASNGTTTYTWDFENRLTSVTLPATAGTVSFRYDPFGRRVEKVSSSGTTIFAYDGDNSIDELNAAGTSTARYTQGLGIDEPLAEYRSGVASYYHAEGLGSIVALTNSTGFPTTAYLYDSFGNLVASAGNVVNPFRYTAREFDTETGLYYYRARYYDSTVGRFLSEDPLAFNVGLNFYPYVSGDPITSPILRVYLAGVTFCQHGTVTAVARVLRGVPRLVQSTGGTRRTTSMPRSRGWLVVPVPNAQSR